MIGITLTDASGIGDKLQFTSLPENYFRNTGERMIDQDSAWVFDHNPYVVRGATPSRSINVWTWKGSSCHSPNPQDPVLQSIAQRTTTYFRHIAFLRHPRLYRFEDLPQLTNRIVIHTTGKRTAPIVREWGEDEPRILGEEIVATIKRTYASYDIIQVGASDDQSANVVDCRGVDLWETARIIAQAAIFIGVDSGPSWIASCYPRVFAKKVLVQYPPSYLRDGFRPMQRDRPHEHWHDHSFTYFNRSTEDAGITLSYTKL